MCIMCVILCLFSALSRRVGALQIFIIIIMVIIMFIIIITTTTTATTTIIIIIIIIINDTGPGVGVVERGWLRGWVGGEGWLVSS